LNEVTAVQRKVLHGFGGHGGTYGCAVGLKKRRTCGDFNDGGLGTELEVDVGTGTVAGFNGEVLGDRCFEPAGLDGNGVVADWKEREDWTVWCVSRWCRG